jgi:hypothetical protein
MHRDRVVSYVPLFGEGVGGHPNVLSPCTREGEWEGVGSTGVEGWKGTLSVHTKGGGRGQAGGSGLTWEEGDGGRPCASRGKGRGVQWGDGDRG